MLNLDPNLILDRCPHCSIANPNLHRVNIAQSRDHAGKNLRVWSFYCCRKCGGMVTASAVGDRKPVTEIFPSSTKVSKDIPSKARSYLEQAIASIHAPAGAVMLSASAVDALLKEKEYKEGSLYDRIEKAVQDNLLTSEMASWAHEVRLDANEQRHSDEEVSLPNGEDAKKAIDFTLAIAEYLYVLPAKVQRGRQS